MPLTVGLYPLFVTFHYVFSIKEKCRFETVTYYRIEYSVLVIGRLKKNTRWLISCLSVVSFGRVSYAANLINVSLTYWSILLLDLPASSFSGTLVHVSSSIALPNFAQLIVLARRSFWLWVRAQNEEIHCWSIYPRPIHT